MRWRNLIAILVVLGLAAGAYYFLTGGNGTEPPATGTQGMQAKISVVFSRNGADIKAFSGALPVSLGEDSVDTKIKPASFTALKSGLSGLQTEAKTAQEKSLLSLYQSAVALTETKYDLLRKTQQLSNEVEGKDASQACMYKDRLDALSLDYTKFFVSLTDLSVQELDYSKKYGKPAPLGLGSDEERGTMDSLTLLSMLYNKNCTGAAV